MPLSRPNPLDLNNATPRPFPRLPVRNRSSDRHPVNSNDALLSSEDSTAEIQHPSDNTRLPLSNPAHPHARLNYRHQRHDSKDTQVTDRHSRSHPSKRKSNGVLGFFSLKEPSTSALEEFAEHERRKAAQKGAKSPTAVLPGVSSQKLPDHVPKVNSKWDGLPDSVKAKRKDSEPKVKDQEQRSSQLSLASSSDSTRRPYGSLSSKPSFRKSHDKKRIAVQVTELPSESRPDSQQSCPIVLPPSATHPALRQPTSSSSRPECYSTSPPELRDYSSGTVTSPEASPRTPALDLVLPTGKSDGCTYSPFGHPLPTDASGTFYLSDSDEVMIRSAGRDVLGRPATDFRHTKPTTTRVGGQLESTPPAQPKIAIISQSVIPGNDASPNVVRNFSHLSKYYSRDNLQYSVTSRTASPPPATLSSAESTRPTTMASNITSTTRATSLSPARTLARSVTPGSPGVQVQPPMSGRPGVPRKGRKDDVAPWEAFEPPTEETTPRAYAIPDSGKLKRLSYKLSRK